MTVIELFPATPVTEDQFLVHYIDTDARSHVVDPGEASKVAFEHALLVRAIRNNKGQRNTIGKYWSSTTKRHIQFESFLESCWLTIFDFDPTITAMAAQPFRLTGRVDGALVDHVPDFFLRRHDRGIVVDVRAEALQDERFAAQVAATQRFCDQAGFGYEVLNEPELQWWTNVRFLAGYRRPLAAGFDHTDRIVDLATDPVPFRSLAAFIDEPALARAMVLHLCWRQDLIFDLSQRLHDGTLLTARRTN